MPNLACNLLYNNGNENLYVGFAGTCTPQNMRFNIRKASQRWCNQPACSCKQFADNGYQGALLPAPCIESSLFTEWVWNPGEEFATRSPFRIAQPVEGKVAVLTTRFADQDTEGQRKIVGFFKVASVEGVSNIHADRYYRLRLLREEAKVLDFWSYYRNRRGDKPNWRQKRYRFLEDDRVAAILHDLYEIVQSNESKSMIRQLLWNDFDTFATERPVVQGYFEPSVVQHLRLQRKYGGRGESPAHRTLKEYIATHPEVIGIEPSTVHATMEHPYISGDLVDILFAPVTGIENTVVEVELDIIKPGIHQAIKYRALRCAQLDLSLDDPTVKAVIVAWQFTPDEIALCKQYGIRHIVCQQGRPLAH